MPFTKGHKLATGGVRSGAGRKSEDFKTALGKAIEENDILGGVIKMASGQIEVSDKVRLSASLWLLEMHNGKPAQGVQLSGSDGEPIIVEIVNH